MSENTLKPQTTLRDYIIKRVLGRGSFGVTYLAEKIAEHYAVAIKEYLPVNIALRDQDGTTVSVSGSSQGDREEFQSGLDKFLEESRTLSGLKSPHIVQVVDSFELNGTAYMVMKYEEGGTLNRYLEAHQEPLTESQIFAVFTPLLEGLRTIHAKWLLHRDIKPENIYIRKDGSPLLIDFGTARHALSAKRGGMTEYLTPGFAPPEQYDRNADHGPWTDIYAVGATMYYCVTRIKPYEGRFRTNKADPLVSATRAASAMYDRKLLEIIDWMMIPDHEKRPQSVDEVLLPLLELNERLSPAEDSTLAAEAGKEGQKETRARGSGRKTKARAKKTTRRASKSKSGAPGKKPGIAAADAESAPETPRPRSGTVEPTDVVNDPAVARGGGIPLKPSWLFIGAAVIVLAAVTGFIVSRIATVDVPGQATVTTSEEPERGAGDSAQQPSDAEETKSGTPQLAEADEGGQETAEEPLEADGDNEPAAEPRQSTRTASPEAATPTTLAEVSTKTQGQEAAKSSAASPSPPADDGNAEPAAEPRQSTASVATEDATVTASVETSTESREQEVTKSSAASPAPPADDGNAEPAAEPRQSTPSAATEDATATASVETSTETREQETTKSSAEQPADDGKEALEIALWNAVKDSDDTREIQAYIDRYPNGTFAGLARARLTDLQSRSLKDALDVAVEGPEVVPLNRKTYYTINSNNAVKARWSIGGFTNGWVQVDPMVDGHQIYIEPTDSSRIGDSFTLVFEVFDDSGNVKKVRKKFRIGR